MYNIPCIDTVVSGFDVLNDSEKQEIASAYINSQVVYLQNEVVEFILKADASIVDSYFETQAPFCYDDITNNTPTGSIEINGEWLDLTEEERDEKLAFYEYLEGKAWDYYASCENGHSDHALELHTRVEGVVGKLNDMSFDDYPEIYQWFLWVTI